jgi:hypothetical protein
MKTAQSVAGLAALCTTHRNVHKSVNFLTRAPNPLMSDNVLIHTPSIAVIPDKIHILFWCHGHD